MDSLSSAVFSDSCPAAVSNGTEAARGDSGAAGQMGAERRRSQKLVERVPRHVADAIRAEADPRDAEG